MEDKKNERDLLRQQMELMAEKSKDCQLEDLPRWSLAMVEIYKALYWKPEQARGGVGNRNKR